MEMKDAMDIMAEKSKRIGADQFDVLAGVSESTGLSVFKGEVQNVELSNSRGIGVRLFRDGYPGYAHTEKFSKEAIQDAVDSAWDNSFLTGVQKMKLPEAVELPKEDLNLYSTLLENVELSEFTSLCLEMESTALAADEIENVPYLGMTKSTNEVAILNSNNLYYSNKSNLLSGGIGCVAKRGEGTKLGYYSKNLKDLSHFNPKLIAQEAVFRAKELLGAKSVPGGKYPVVLSNRVSAQLFSMFSSGFSAEMVQKGQSKLDGKLGKKIANENISIYNEPHRSDLSGSSYFDAEGVATQNISVVENGVLNSYLYNLESAAQEGVKPTGTGTRGYSGKAGTSFNNYVIPLGEKSLVSLLKEMGTGLYVLKLEGGSGCSGLSGDISIGVQGMWVENGEVQFPVDGVTLSTNFYDLLFGVVSLSNSYNEQFSSYKISDILINEVSVAG